MSRLEVSQPDISIKIKNILVSTAALYNIFHIREHIYILYHISYIMYNINVSVHCSYYVGWFHDIVIISCDNTTPSTTSLYLHQVLPRLPSPGGGNTSSWTLPTREPTVTSSRTSWSWGRCQRGTWAVSSPASPPTTTCRPRCPARSAWTWSSPPRT